MLSDGTSKISMGLFGVAGRDNAKILNKQNQLLGPGIGNLLSTLKKSFALSGNSWTRDAEFVDLFTQMLHLHPGRRISPEEILEHPFMLNVFEEI